MRGLYSSRSALFHGTATDGSFCNSSQRRFNSAMNSSSVLSSESGGRVSRSRSTSQSRSVSGRAKAAARMEWVSLRMDVGLGSESVNDTEGFYHVRLLVQNADLADVRDER